MSKVIHRGLLHSRTLLPNGKLEKAFADEWEKEAPRVLGFVVAGPSKKDEGWLFKDCAVYSQRDAQVAADVIQWLGTNVGSCFLRNVLGHQAAKDLIFPLILTAHPDLCEQIVALAKQRTFIAVRGQGG